MLDAHLSPGPFRTHYILNSLPGPKRIIATYTEVLTTQHDKTIMSFDQECVQSQSTFYPEGECISLVNTAGWKPL